MVEPRQRGSWIVLAMTAAALSSGGEVSQGLHAAYSLRVVSALRCA